MNRKALWGIGAALLLFSGSWAAEWRAECNGNTVATCESRKIAAEATAKAIEFSDGFFPETRAAAITPETGLSWPLTTADFNVNKGTASFWFKPLGWGNGKKYEGKENFVPVWAIDQEGGHNWAYVAFVAWGSSGQMKLQMQTHGKKGGKDIYFQGRLPAKAFLPDQWSLLTFTWSDMEISTYINGERIGISDYGLPFEKTFDPHWKFTVFPRDFWSNQNFPPALVCSVRMVDRVLPAAEIQQQYLSGIAATQSLSTAEAPVPQVTTSVKVDGTVNAEEWQDASSFPVGLMFGNGIYNSDTAGRLYLKHDGKNLYGALTVAEVKPVVTGAPGEMGIACYKGAVCDFWWGRGEKVHSQLGIAPNGAWAYRNEKEEWQPLECPKAGAITDEGWSVEFALPLTLLQVKPGETLDANLCFQRPSAADIDNQWLVWNLPHPKQPLNCNWGKLHFLTASAPVRVEGLANTNYGEVKVRLQTGAEATAKVESSFPLKQEKDCWTGNLAAGNGTLRMQAAESGAVTYNQELKFSVVDPLQFRTLCHAAARTIDCRLDWRGLMERCRGRKTTGIFTVAGEADGKVYGQKEVELTNGQEFVELPFAELPAGNYNITAEVRCGKDSWNKKITLIRPDETFLRVHCGLDRTIPPPFVPLESTDHSVKAVHLAYTFPDKMPFPEQATSGGVPLLQKTLALELVIGGKPQKLTPTAFAVTEKAPDRQIAEGELVTESQALKIRWKRITAYDGMLKYHLEVIPNGKITIDRLRVAGVTDAEHSRYCLAPNYQPEWLSKGFCNAFPYLHLTGREAGFTLFTDNDANWIFDRVDPLRARRLTDGAAEISANFIDRPIAVSQPVSYVLGVMGSPSKLVRNDWRTIHHAGWGVLKGENLQVLMGNTPPRFLRGHEFSMPIDANIRHWIKRMKESRAGVTRLIPYIFGDAFSSNTPAADYYGGDWLRTVNGVAPARGYESVDVDGTAFALLGVAVCFNKPGPTDYMVYNLDQLLLKYPEFCGIYIDGGGPMQSDTPYPGTSITPILRPDQVVRNWNLFGKRDLLERYYKVIKQRRGESGILFNHNWDNYPPCLVSFCDLLYPGEEYMHSIRSGLQVYVEGTPLEKWQSNYNSRLHGAGVQFLGQWRFHGGDLITQTPAKRKEYTRPVLMMCLLHDVPLDGAWYPDVEQEWKLLDDQKVQQADFIGYWFNEELPAPADPQVKLSFYRWADRPEKLLILGNLSRVEKTVSLAALSGSLTDALNGEAVALDSVKIEGPFGFRLLLWKPENGQ